MRNPYDELFDHELGVTDALRFYAGAAISAVLQKPGFSTLTSVLTFLSTESRAMAMSLQPAKFKTHASQIIAAVPQFLSRCVTDPAAPPIFSDSLLLCKDSLLPVVAATFLVNLSEEYIGDSGLLRTALFVFSWLRALQFQIRLAVLLMTLPKIFQAMPKASGIEPLDNAVCKDCSTLYFAQREVHAVIAYVYRQIVLRLIENREIVGNIAGYAGIVVTPFLRMYYTGLLLAEYCYALTICAMHRDINFQSKPELFMTLGFFYGVTTFILSSVMPASAAILNALLTKAFGEVCVLTPMMNALSRIPSETLHPYVSGISMVYFIGLVFHMPLPKPVSYLTRQFPGLGADFVADRIMKHTIAEITNVLKNNDERATVIRYFQTLVHWVRAQKSLPETVYDYRLTQHCLPTLFQSKDALFNDRFLSRLWPLLFKEVNKVIGSILKVRESVLPVIKISGQIKAVLDQRCVQLVVRLAGGGAFLDMAGKLTFSYLMDNGPALLNDMIIVLSYLKSTGVIQPERIDDICKTLETVGNHITQLRNMLKDVPASLINELYALMESRQFVNSLKSISGWTNDQLVTRSAGLEILGYDLPEQEDYLNPTASSCRFPRDAAVDFVEVRPRTMTTPGVVSATSEENFDMIEHAECRAASVPNCDFDDSDDDSVSPTQVTRTQLFLSDQVEQHAQRFFSLPATTQQNKPITNRDANLFCAHS